MFACLLLVPISIMDYLVLQAQYDNTYSYFKTTTEPFDFLEWDDRVLNVWLGNSIIEVYEYADLAKLIKGF